MQLARRYFHSNKIVAELLQEGTERQVATMFKKIQYLREFGTIGPNIMRVDEKLERHDIDRRRKVILEEARERLLEGATPAPAKEAYRSLIESMGKE